MQADIDEMLEHFHDNDVEVLTILNNTITLHDHMKRALIRNERALKKALFRQDHFSGSGAEKAGDAVHRKGRDLKGYHPLGGGGLARARGQRLL